MPDVGPIGDAVSARRGGQHRLSPIHADTNNVSAYIDAEAKATAAREARRRCARGGRCLRWLERAARGAPYYGLPQPADAGFEPEPRPVRPGSSDCLSAGRYLKRTGSAHGARPVDVITQSSGA